MVQKLEALYNICRIQNSLSLFLFLVCFLRKALSNSERTAELTERRQQWHKRQKAM